jgi:RNA ligase
MVDKMEVNQGRTIPMFKRISHISDVQPAVEHKKEIRFSTQPNGITVGCYQFLDSHTFDSPEALECRGIAFGPDGEIISRPLHKFFNVGEKQWLSPQSLLQRTDVAAVYEKLDGSMIATALVDGKMQLRSKKSFGSDVVHLASAFIDLPENASLKAFAEEVAQSGMTAIFELTHPQARIVVDYKQPALRLLHVRDNVTGEYVMLDSKHPVHALVKRYNVPTVPQFEGLSLAGAFSSVQEMRDREGYVIQFQDGDMVKLKCPWYLRLHRSISLLRERDIAELALAEELDDLKASLAEVGTDLGPIEEIEHRVATILSGMLDQIEAAYAAGKDLSRKDFAIANKGHPLFGLMMQRYLGTDVQLVDWYRRNRLKEDFGLRVLASGAVAEAIEG